MMRAISRVGLVRILVPAAGDFLLLILALKATGLLRGDSVPPGLIVSFLPPFAGFLGVFYAAGLYDLRRVRDFVTLIGNLMTSGAACAVAGTVYFYLFSPYLGQTPKTFLILTVILSHMAMLGWRRAILGLTDFSLMRLRLLVLASDEHVAHLRQDHVRRAEEGGLDLADALGPGVDLVVADSAWIEANWEKAKVVLSEAVERGISVVSLERFYESMFGKVSPLYAGDPSWALEHILPRADGLYFKARRALDLSAALTGLVVLSPLLLLTAALIRLVDGMPPLYAQRRVGYLGRTFVLWKFRTMRPNSDASGPFHQARPGEREMITPLGAFLRRFRLDEFPQLWNVVRGEMSLVGPRPEWIKEVEILEKLVPNYHLRHLVPPGITGWAQVYFRATSDPKDSVEKHHYDLYYLKHFSPALDMSILLKTVKRVFVKDSRVSSVVTPFPRALRPAPATLVDIASIISRS